MHKTGSRGRRWCPRLTEHKPASLVPRPVQVFGRKGQGLRAAQIKAESGYRRRLRQRAPVRREAGPRRLAAAEAEPRVGFGQAGGVDPRAVHGFLDRLAPRVEFEAVLLGGEGHLDAWNGATLAHQLQVDLAPPEAAVHGLCLDVDEGDLVQNLAIGLGRARFLPFLRVLVDNQVAAGHRVRLDPVRIYYRPLTVDDPEVHPALFDDVATIFVVHSLYGPRLHGFRVGRDVLSEAFEGGRRLDHGGYTQLLAYEDGGAAVQRQRDRVRAAETVEKAKELEESRLGDGGRGRGGDEVIKVALDQVPRNALNVELQSAEVGGRAAQNSGDKFSKARNVDIHAAEELVKAPIPGALVNQLLIHVAQHDCAEVAHRLEVVVRQLVLQQVPHGHESTVLHIGRLEGTVTWKEVSPTLNGGRTEGGRWRRGDITTLRYTPHPPPRSIGFGDLRSCPCCLRSGAGG